MSPERRFVTTCTSESTRDNLIASITFSLGFQSALLPAKRQKDCAWKHQLCLSRRFAGRGANRKEKAALESHRAPWWRVAEGGPILPFPSPKQVMARGTRPHLQRHRPSGSRNGSSCSSPAMREFCPWPQSFHKTSRSSARGSWVTSVSGEDSSRSQSQKHKNLSVL